MRSRQRGKEGRRKNGERAGKDRKEERGRREDEKE